MKKIVCLAMALLAGVTMAANLSMAEARKQIDSVIAEPTKMTEILKQLDPSSQVEFVSEVNAAISALPGSTEDKAATFLNVNSAALKGASKGNLAPVVAEIFATVPVEALPAISENFAASSFNRAADPATTYTDDRFKQIVEGVMSTVNKRMEKADNGDVRSAFAGLMMIRASNSTSPEMVLSIVATLPESAREAASKEWFPAALAEGEAKSYEPMMAAADAGEVFLLDRVIRIPSGAPQIDVLLADLIGSNVDPGSKSDDRQQLFDAVTSQANLQDGLTFVGVAGVAQPRAVEYAGTSVHESIGYQLQETR